jgi:hypothetical protein
MHWHAVFSKNERNKATRLCVSMEFEADQFSFIDNKFILHEFTDRELPNIHRECFASFIFQALLCLILEALIHARRESRRCCWYFS